MVNVVCLCTATQFDRGIAIILQVFSAMQFYFKQNAQVSHNSTYKNINYRMLLDINSNEQKRYIKQKHFDCLLKQVNTNTVR